MERKVIKLAIEKKELDAVMKEAGVDPETAKKMRNAHAAIEARGHGLTTPDRTPVAEF
jgi:hypothetical protein